MPEEAVRLSAGDFEDCVIASDVPVFVDFWASWCPPCKAVDPVLNELAERYAGRAKVAKLQVDLNPAIRDRFAIQGVPTFITFRDGAEVERAVGVLPCDHLASMIDRVLESDAGS